MLVAHWDKDIAVQGVLHYEDNSKREGTFQSGKWNGEVIYTNNEAKKYKEIWQNDKKVMCTSFEMMESRKWEIKNIKSSNYKTEEKWENLGNFAFQLDPNIKNFTEEPIEIMTNAQRGLYVGQLDERYRPEGSGLFVDRNTGGKYEGKWMN